MATDPKEKLSKLSITITVFVHGCLETSQLSLHLESHIIFAAISVRKRMISHQIRWKHYLLKCSWHCNISHNIARNTAAVRQKISWGKSQGEGFGVWDFARKHMKL